MRAHLLRYAITTAIAIAWAWAAANMDGLVDACETDAECMAFCPPPADEPTCDGGPEESS